jgi:hypothetical protein
MPSKNNFVPGLGAPNQLGQLTFGLRYGNPHITILASDQWHSHWDGGPLFSPSQRWLVWQTETPGIVLIGMINHFGENAELDAATARQILDLLTAGVADAGGGNRQVMRGLSANQAPLRITETPSWIRKHGKGRVAAALTAAKAKSPRDCVACHAGAVSGVFDND